MFECLISPKDKVTLDQGGIHLNLTKTYESGNSSSVMKDVMARIPFNFSTQFIKILSLYIKGQLKSATMFDDSSQQRSISQKISRHLKRRLAFLRASTELSTIIVKENGNKAKGINPISSKCKESQGSVAIKKV